MIFSCHHHSTFISPRCDELVDAEKQLTVHDAPIVLTIHFKRFTALGRKLCHQVDYGEQLSLHTATSKGRKCPSYSLYAVICHIGGELSSGHYIACVKHGNGQWYDMNDGLVSRLTSAPVNLKSAYILFYLQN
jgi:ubiquitin carboxyl-terminal hydrolase 36/42